MIIAVIGNYDPPPHVYALAASVGGEWLFAPAFCRGGIIAENGS